MRAKQLPVVERQPHRLDPRPNEIIDRDVPVRFRFAGRRISAVHGDTISSALWANGMRVIGRSFKYHRPRADFSFDGTDPNALVQIGDEPNVRAGTRPVDEGLDVRPQNVQPSLRFDVMAANETLSRFLPVGFYYKAFHSRRLWPLYEKIIRRAAGLGKVSAHTPEGYYDKQYRYADVTVVGSGPAGLAAALSAAEAGATVLLLERGDQLGGSVRWGPALLWKDDAGRQVRQMLEAVAHHPRIDVLRGATAMGYYDDHYLAAFAERRLYKTRSRALVVATGAIPRIPLFANNDLPGVVTGNGAARLLNLHAVRPGRHVLVASSGDRGLALALELHEAGVGVAVAESRSRGTARDSHGELVEQLQSAGVEVRWERSLSAAHGRASVQGIDLTQGTSGSLEHVRCDALALCCGHHPDAGLLAQAGARLRWSGERNEFTLEHLPAQIHAAGDVAGTHELPAALLEGRIAGARAARDAGYGVQSAVPAGDDGDEAALQEQKSAQPVSSAPFSCPPAPPGDEPNPFRFVDFSEDVTDKDVRDAIDEGYASNELLKRYTTVSMGPDQGRYGSVNATMLSCQYREVDPTTVALTTSRPPTFPVKLGVMAGRKLEPLRRTPMHHWHERAGCSWVHPGLWRRPDVYRDHDPQQTVRRVRNDVGLIDVSTLGKVWLRGKDVRELLMRVYTNKWQKLPVGKARYGVMCNEEGVIVDDGVTARFGEDEYYMTITTPSSAAVPQSILWWQEYAWDLDVHLVNVTTQYAGINVAGPKSRQLLLRVSDDVDLSNEAFPFMGVRRGTVAGVPCLLLRIGFTGELSYEVHFPAGYGEHVWEALLEAGTDLGVVPVGLESLGILRLEKGHILVGQDTHGLATPLEADLEWAVKWDKEDFVGKAGVARREQHGRSQALVGFHTDDSSVCPPEGSIVVDENQGGEQCKIGWVTSARYSPTLERPIGMAWVPSDRSEPGARVRIRFDEQLVSATVVDMPFFDPDGTRLKQ